MSIGASVARKYLWFTLFLLGGLTADQGTKQWVLDNIEFGIDEIQIIPGWLSFVHAHNTGAAFSMLEGAHYLFLGFTVIAAVVVVDMLRRLPEDARFHAAILGMLLSGAFGNAIDRIRLGHVTDFVKCYTDYPPLRDWLIEQVGTSVYPIWNVADASLLVGVAIFLLHGLFFGDVPEEAEAPEPPDDVDTVDTDEVLDTVDTLATVHTPDSD